MHLHFSETYKKNVIKWLKISDFVDGSVGRVAKYLKRHEAESITAPSSNKQGASIGERIYQVRRDRLYNSNFCDFILSSWMSQFAAQEISWGVDDVEDFQAILDDITGEQQSAKHFIRDAFYNLGAYGLIGILTESSFDGTNLENARSYSVLYKALDIPSVTRAPNGELVQVVVFQDDLVDDKNKEKMRIRVFTKTPTGYTSQNFIQKQAGSIFKKIDGNSFAIPKEVKEGIEFVEESPAIESELDHIPFVLIGKDASESLIKNTVEKNDEYLNKKSVVDLIEYQQGYKRIAAVGVQPGELAAWNEFLIALFENQNASIIEISPTDPKANKESLNELKMEIIQEGLMRFEEISNLPSRERQTAESKQLDLVTFESYLNYLADIMQEGVQRVIRNHAAFENTQVDVSEIITTISREFNTGETEIDQQNFLLMTNLLRDYGQAGREIIKRLIVAKLQKMKLGILPGDEKTEEALKIELLERLEKSQPEQFALAFQQTNVADELESVVN